MVLGERWRRRTAWAPPRGRRDPGTGDWWALEARRFTAGEGPVEREAVEAYRRLVRGLYTRRAANDLTLRELSSLSGVPLSVVAAVERGSSWHRLATFQALAGSLGLSVVVDGVSDVVGRLDAEAEAQRRSLAWVAEQARLNPGTLYAMVQRQTRSPSMATVLAIAAVLGLEICLEPVAGVRGEPATTA